MSSTQKAHTVDDAGTTIIARNHQDYIQTVPDQTANFSPKISSTQKMYTVIGNQVDDSPLDTVSPSPVVSPQRESMSPSLAPGSSTRKEHRNTTAGMDHAGNKYLAGLWKYHARLAQLVPFP